MGNGSKGERTMPTTQPRTKVCTRCKKRRKLDQFYKDKTVKDGHSSWCKACTKEYDREYAARKKAARAS
jgi:hypothetical protein